MQNCAGLGDVVKLSTDNSQPCKLCQLALSGKKIDESINHYVKAHNYRVLHVGTETSLDLEGKPWHDTVAVLGV